jgi:hypothetical protein
MLKKEIAFCNVAITMFLFLLSYQLPTFVEVGTIYWTLKTKYWTREDRIHVVYGNRRKVTLKKKIKPVSLIWCFW